MAKLKKYDLDGKDLGEVELEDSLLERPECSQLIKDAIVALQRNKRQWSANTKGRSEVSYSNQKPHKQKGTGKARQGSLASPQYRGGGIVFGPKPKFDQHIRINQKERRKAVLALYAQKAKEGTLHLLEDKAFTSELTEPKTKRIAKFLGKLGLEGKRVLFVAPASSQENKNEKKGDLPGKNHQHFFRSVQNISRAEVLLAPNVNGFALAKASSLVVCESALEEIRKLLAKGKG